MLAIARARAKAVGDVVNDVKIDERATTTILRTTRQEFGDVVVRKPVRTPKGTVDRLTVEPQRVRAEVDSCFRTLAGGSSANCGRSIRYAICDSFFAHSLNRSQLGACRQNGSASFAQQALALKVQAEQLRLFNAATDTSDPRMPNLRFEAFGVRKNKETTYWSRADLNSFLKEGWNRGQFVETENLPVIKRFEPDPNRDPRLNGGSTRLIQVQYGDYRVNVRICEVEPCPRGTKGQMLAVFPECGPGVFKILPSAQILSSVDKLNDYASTVRAVPCP